MAPSVTDSPFGETPVVDPDAALAEGRRHLGAGRLGAAETRLRAALSAYRAIWDGLGEAEALGALALLAIRRARHEEALGLLETQAEIWRACGNSERLSSCLILVAHCERQTGRLDHARRHHAESGAVVGTQPELRTAAAQAVEAAHLAEAAGDVRAAQGHLERTVRLLSRLGDDAALARALADLGRVSAANGDLNAARTAYRDSIAAHQRCGDATSTAAGVRALETLDVADDRPSWTDGQAVDLAAAIPPRSWASLLDSGEVALHAGRIDLAEQYARQVAAMAAQLGRSQLHAEALLLLGEAALERADPATARGNLESALRGLRRKATYGERIRVLIGLGRADLLAGHRGRARRRAEKIRTATSATPRMALPLVPLLIDLSDAHAKAGESERSRDCLAAAADVAQAAGDDQLARRIAAQLGAPSRNRGLRGRAARGSRLLRWHR